MATAPALIEATIRHQVMLEQLKSGEVEKIAKYLREIDKVLRDRLTRDDLTGWSRDRLEKMLAEVDGQILAIYSRYSRQLNADLVDIAEYEAAFESRSLNALMTDFAVAVPTLPALRAAIKARPLQVSGAGGGKLLDTFIEDWTSTERSRVINAVRLGFTQGLTNFQIIQSLRGTKAANYSDGILAISSRNADAIVRTAVQHVSNVARFETWSANSDVVTGFRWVSTLDSRTTQVCRSLDGRVFSMGNGPMPPAHIRCRSTTAAELDSRFDFLKKGATRSSKDGYVDAGETYYDWLAKQPASFQDQAIGKARGKLFRDGGLSVDRFTALQLDRRFKPLTLAQLRELEPLAFERAGIQ
ncbi:phage head morphogenesis protein [Pseudomonas lactis]|uniref:minor capsid protein n=1 Tax=Pseudomonas TaxID=286 RepID=UPI000BB5DE45|nr:MULTISPECIES: minor capsid protein [Pseudomonas]MBA5956248.1 phage head morphogenesis protein [Pseudomonas lactis]PRW80100.1 phage head morphogenesis protein [Pseudomonas fluorescens]PRW80875.1 phage head morphogenesis protein [Pseudomonas fluorescens]